MHIQQTRWTFFRFHTIGNWITEKMWQDSISSSCVSSLYLSVEENSWHNWSQFLTRLVQVTCWYVAHSNGIGWVCRFIPLSGELYIVYFGTIYTHPQTRCTSIKMDYSTRIMHRAQVGQYWFAVYSLANGMAAAFTQYETNETFMSRNGEKSIYTQHPAHANIKECQIAIELVWLNKSPYDRVSILNYVCSRLKIANEWTLGSNTNCPTLSVDVVKHCLVCFDSLGVEYFNLLRR